MKKKMKKSHRTLFQLLTGIFLWGVLIQIGGIIFAAEKFKFASGLWCGIIISGGMAGHMLFTLEEALELGVEGAEKKVRKGHALRISVITILSCVIIYFGIGNILGFFLGIMALKPAAYFQPYLDKQMLRREE